MICSPISHHDAIFHVAGNVIADVSRTTNPIIRHDMCHKTIKKFVNEMKEINWQCLIVDTPNLPIANSMKLCLGSITIASHAVNLQNHTTCVNIDYKQLLNNQ